MSNQPAVVEQVFQKSISVSQEIRQAVYQFGELPKPCVHPLTTPAGKIVTGFEPSDHVWHRGVWFTVKFVNGENFWEEREPYGVQQSSAEPTVEWLGPVSARIRHKQIWSSAKNGAAIEESRTVSLSFENARWTTVDFATELTFKQPTLLDRTPYTTWGGYGGFSFRASRELHDVKFLVSNGETPTAITGQSHDWVLLTALTDGGKDKKVSIAMLDHPSNPRTPSPWYCKSNNGFTFMNAAFLFNEAMNVGAGQTLKFKYRLLAGDGVATAEEVAEAAKNFRAEEA